MPCVKCGSHNLWDDSMNPIWGCNDCGWFGTEHNSGHRADRYNASSNSCGPRTPPEPGLVFDGETWAHGRIDPECGEE